MNEKRLRMKQGYVKKARYIALENPDKSALDIWHDLGCETRAINLYRVITGYSFGNMVDPPPARINYSHYSPREMVGHRLGNHNVMSIEDEEVRLQCVTCNHVIEITDVDYKNMFSNGIAKECEHCKYLSSNYFGKVTFEEYLDRGKVGLACSVCGNNLSIEDSEYCRICHTLNSVLDRAFEMTLPEYLEGLEEEDYD